jgi:hypothetical protein
MMYARGLGLIPAWQFSSDPSIDPDVIANEKWSHGLQWKPTEINRWGGYQLAGPLDTVATGAKYVGYGLLALLGIGFLIKLMPK